MPATRILLLTDNKAHMWFYARFWITGGGGGARRFIWEG